MKRGTPRHPKVAHIRELLKVAPATAIGYLELMFHFTAEFAPQGDIGRFDDGRIEAALGWKGKRGVLIAALIESHWLDRHLVYRLVVHHWHDHADDAVRKRLQRANLPFLSLIRKVTGQWRPPADNGSLPEPEPEPMPEPEPEPEPMPEPEPEPEPPKRVRAPATTARADLLDEQWADFRIRYEATGRPLIDEDWSMARHSWNVLDHDQRAIALAGIAARIEAGHWTDPNFIPSPARYLQGEYKRKVIPKTNGGAKVFDIMAGV